MAKLEHETDGAEEGHTMGTESKYELRGKQGKLKIKSNVTPRALTRAVTARKLPVIPSKQEPTISPVKIP